MGSMDPQNGKRKEAKDKSKVALARLGLDLSKLDLTEHEEIIAAEIVHSDDIGVNFKGEPSRSELYWSNLLTPYYVDIGGLDPIIGQLRESVVFPLCYPQLFDSAAGLFGAPKGVLLYGPPGCGKTMLAKVRHWLLDDCPAVPARYRPRPSPPR